MLGATAAAERNGGTAVNPMSRSIRPVLLVEDDADYALLVKMAFKEAGAPNPVRAARTAEEAIEYLAGTSPYDDRRLYPVPAHSLSWICVSWAARGSI